MRERCMEKRRVLARRGWVREMGDFFSSLLENQHRITIAVKAVTFANRFPISSSKKFSPGQRGDQHQQRGTWHVKIREEGVDHLEPEPWSHEHLCLSPIGSDPALRTSRSFERADNSGPDSDNASSLTPHLLNGMNRLCSDFDPLGTHLMVFDVIDGHRLEGPDTDMKRDRRDTHPS